MYDQWVKAGKPKPDQFKWQPVNACPVTSDFKVTDYAFFGKLIWSTFTWLGSKRTEPFGGIFKSNADNSLYLIFRGSKTFADFCVDAEAGLEPYKAPITPVPSDTRVEQGWYKVYIGLRDTLLTQLSQIGTAQPLTITGHSLGSALATLAVPDAVAKGFQVHHYNSASPRVGNEQFRMYYDSLKVTSSGSLKETYRLVNTADTVPNFPGPPLHPWYVHVGTEVSFNADYGAEEKTHNPCCSYAYAIYNPDKPCNPTFDACNVPK